MSTGDIVAIVEDRCLDDPIYKRPDGNSEGDSGGVVGVGVGVGSGAAAGHPPADPALAPNETATLVRRGGWSRVWCQGRRELHKWWFWRGAGFTSSI